MLEKTQLTIEQFDQIDSYLFDNGFAYYDDWEYGPQYGYSIPHERFRIYLMRGSYGYSICLNAHASGTNKKFPIGTSNSAEDIINLKQLLERLF